VQYGWMCGSLPCLTSLSHDRWCLLKGKLVYAAHVWVVSSAALPKGDLSG
jgi:hypothetical protein